MNKSKIKTWFKRNGFKPDYGAFRANWQYCHKDGRHYRIRDNEDGVEGFVVDTSDLDFDRWANSTEVYAQPVSEFISWHVPNRQGDRRPAATDLQEGDKE